MKRRSIDKEKIARADRESRAIQDAERQARDAKTAKLKEMRIQRESGRTENQSKLNSWIMR
ncbi:hypothetical protein FKO01_51920 [Mesorhizobium sp. B2-3-3]|uniref:hypothetical protein n=1 Tax=unclassified Mesorhizobium TaxID=325217 RepID=UPI00112C1E26|nr:MULTISPECIES: hypothetical protein [unclassified Mesorhizobium]TPK61165.1 hypothetical protein FJ930_27940 [Mesorhizobium sp. B2-4-15]TPM12638.1 hypothetical protein FJ958_31265 [Mesorhizobium sp. B2-3-5]TPM97583.1 hypothetical protein FKO01_51920 [Mesorhizobium sp. B2-3-3]